LKVVIAWLLILLVVSIAILPQSVDAKTKQQKSIDKALGKLGWKSICTVGATTKSNNQTRIVYDAKCIPPGPPPVPCPAGQHRDNTGNCVLDVPPIPPISNVIPKLNTSKSIRVGFLSDMDCNSAGTKELAMFNTYQVQFFVGGGDIGYTDIQCVLDDIAAHGFNGANSRIARGNHDGDGSKIMNWLGSQTTWNHKTFAGGELEVFAVDANAKFDSTSTQYKDITTWLSVSQAIYKIVVVHQPFVTVASTHPNNGQFSVYHQIFQQFGVNVVIEGHNHNYQRFFIDNIVYLVTGTGTHDQGSNLYPTKSNNDGQGHTVIKSYADKNGVTIVDLNIANSTKITQGWFVGMDNKVLDSFINK
jgi:predicted phosphodiesterase